MLDAALVTLALGVALVYFTIAAAIVPKIGLGDATRRFTLLFRTGGGLFFVGCGLTHLHIAAHTLEAPAAVHEVVFHAFQFVGGWIFIFVAMRYISINVEPKSQAEQRRRVRELEHLAVRDPLTGAYNRRFYEEALDKELGRQRRYGGHVSIVLFDIDDFKLFNSRGGHQFGDEVLRAVASTGRKVVRPSDSVVRLGGDEFVLLLPESTQMAALAVAERLRARIRDLGAENTSMKVEISAGVASYPDDAGDVRSLNEQADAALYWVKHNGKNGAAVASSVIASSAAGG